MAGPVPHDDREVAYHRNLNGRINARYGEAVKTWADRIVESAGYRAEEKAGKFLFNSAASWLDRMRAARKGTAKAAE